MEDVLLQPLCQACQAIGDGGEHAATAGPLEQDPLDPFGEACSCLHHATDSTTTAGPSGDESRGPLSAAGVGSGGLGFLQPVESIGWFGERGDPGSA
ncbi:MAG: hypothetical protein M3425_03780, partial [Actinomycetota bacterium]|nr:hypothetical protein [Actinomycetota bacterium]